MDQTLLETNDEYLRMLFHERQCVRLVCLTDEVAVIRIGQTPDALAGETVDIERSTLTTANWQWLETMPQSVDELERAFESARVMAVRSRMRNDFTKAQKAAAEYRHSACESSGETNGRMDKTVKFPAVSILLSRHPEGQEVEVVVLHADAAAPSLGEDVWTCAARTLREWAGSFAPEEHQSVAFQVRYSDGNSYTQSFELYGDERRSFGFSLSTFIWRRVAGLLCLYRLDGETLESACQRRDRMHPEVLRRMKMFFERYEIGHSPESMPDTRMEITEEAWRAKPEDYKLVGADGVPRILMLFEAGTCLVPVEIVPSNRSALSMTGETTQAANS